MTSYSYFSKLFSPYPDVWGWIRDVSEKWVESTTFDTERQELILAMTRLIDPMTSPQSKYELMLNILTSSRLARWQQAAKEWKFEVPSHFRLWRGLSDDSGRLHNDLQEAVDEDKPLHISAPLLTSWTLNPSTAESFAEQNGIIISLDIPLAATVMDKWVDDGAFLVRRPLEEEVVVLNPFGVFEVPVDRILVVTGDSLTMIKSAV